MKCPYDTDEDGDCPRCFHQTGGCMMQEQPGQIAVKLSREAQLYAVQKFGRASSPCSPECTHTQEEHDAFDAGLAAGERDPEVENPFDHEDTLYTAWASGYSVGCLNRSHAMEAAKAPPSDPQENTPLSPNWQRLIARCHRKPQHMKDPILQTETVHIPESEIARFQAEVAAWADETFPGQTTDAKCAHLIEEAKEVRDNPGDELEIGDVFLLLCHIAQRGGINPLEAARKKLAINRRRKWGTPDADGVVHHVKETGQELATKLGEEPPDDMKEPTLRAAWFDGFPIGWNKQPRRCPFQHDSAAGKAWHSGYQRGHDACPF